MLTDLVPGMSKQSSIAILTILSVLCAARTAVTQTRPSDDQATRAIRASVTSTLEHGQLSDRIAQSYREFQLIKEAGQFASRGESFEDVASVRILGWSPFNSSGRYWPVESCVVFAMHLYPTTTEHNVGVRMRFKISGGPDARDLKVEHVPPASSSTAASVKCDLHALPYLRAPR
jgi:hypothetical protein